MDSETNLPDDWFETTARENFERAFLPSSGRVLRYLQIGAFTGNASVWLLENVLTNPDSLLVDVDTWDGGGSSELQGIDWAEVYRVYDKRTRQWQLTGQLAPFRTSSYDYLANCFLSRREPFDFIYIDGAHDVVSVLEDAVMSYRVLKPGGLLCFDDYGWQSRDGLWGEPTMAVDMLKVLYAGRLKVLRTGGQCWMKRVDGEVRR